MAFLAIDPHIQQGEGQYQGRMLRLFTRLFTRHFTVTWRFFRERVLYVVPSSIGLLSFTTFASGGKAIARNKRMEVQGRIVVYSITGCPHCLRAKNTLQELGLPYIDINLEVFPQCRGFVRERTGRHTVPQIFFNGTYVGGNDDLQKMVSPRRTT